MRAIFGSPRTIGEIIIMYPECVKGSTLLSLSNNEKKFLLLTENSEIPEQHTVEVEYSNESVKANSKVFSIINAKDINSFEDIVIGCKSELKTEGYFEDVIIVLSDKTKLDLIMKMLLRRKVSNDIEVMMFDCRFALRVRDIPNYVASYCAEESFADIYYRSLENENIYIPWGYSFPLLRLMKETVASDEYLIITHNIPFRIPKLFTNAFNLITPQYNKLSPEHFGRKAGHRDTSCQIHEK